MAAPLLSDPVRTVRIEAASLLLLYLMNNLARNSARLMMLVLHDDAKREYACGPAQGLPDTKVGTFTQALYDEAKKKGWSVISMKNDWKQIFAFDK